MATKNEIVKEISEQKDFKKTYQYTQVIDLIHKVSGGDLHPKDVRTGDIFIAKQTHKSRPWMVLSWNQSDKVLACALSTSDNEFTVGELSDRFQDKFYFTHTVSLFTKKFVKDNFMRSFDNGSMTVREIRNTLRESLAL